MSSDETTRIEPTPLLKDAPSIVAGSEAEAAKFEVKADVKAEAPAAEAAKVEVPKFETPKFETPKIEVPKFELSTSQAPILPPAPQIDPVFVASKQPAAATAAAAPARTRFALLAASVAIAASVGALGGSFAVAKFYPSYAAPTAALPAVKEQVADEVRALKDSLAQLRATTKTLNDNFATLKTTVATATSQNGKIADTLERIEKAQTEARKTATASTSEVTGSVTKQAAVPMVLGDPPTTLKQPVVPGWVLRRVYDGAALIEGREGIIEVEPGIVAPGLGRIEAIKRQDGRWVVVTARGLIVGR